jgi:hypothetical protein
LLAAVAAVAVTLVVVVVLAGIVPMFLVSLRVVVVLLNQQ